MIGEVPQNHHGFALFDPQKMGTFQGMDTYPTKREKENHRLKMPIFLGGYVIVPWRII